MIESVWFSSPIGMITILSENDFISRILFDDKSLQTSVSLIKNPLLEEARKQLNDYFAGKRITFNLPLDSDQLEGFQREVLEIVSDIKRGEILTYGRVAAMLNKPKASRAVGAALAKNPLPILIPCHRVVAANGHLTGYLGQKGITSKKWLLELEGLKIVGEKLV